MNVALIGFGNVGQSFTRVIHEKREMLRDRYDLEIELVAVSDLTKGSVLDDDGLDVCGLLDLVDETGTVEGYRGGVKGLDGVDTVRRTTADVVVEATWTNLETGEPGLTHVREALGSGKHVVASNKGPIALAYRELTELASRKEVQLRYECTVMSGTPVLRTGVEGLAGHRIDSVAGILNGTTNYMLTRMEQGASYDEALREAQSKGYAEADPTADVEGWDAAGKIVILANALMDADLKPADVERRGITGISLGEIREATEVGDRIKLIARAERVGGEVKTSVLPTRMALEDPLWGVTGTMNAVTYMTDGLGAVTVVGRGAGGPETGHGLLSDLLAIHEATA